MDAPGGRRPGRALRRRSWLAGALSAVTAGLGCHRTPADPVAALLAELEAAAESRDADRFGARLAESFRGRGRISRTEAVAQLRRYFAAYESVGLTVYGIEVDREADAPTVRCLVDFSGRGRAFAGLQGLLPPSATFRFTLETAASGDGLEVRTAEWQAVALEGE